MHLTGSYQLAFRDQTRNVNRKIYKYNYYRQLHIRWEAEVFPKIKSQLIHRRLANVNSVLLNYLFHITYILIVLNENNKYFNNNMVIFLRRVFFFSIFFEMSRR